MQNWTFVPRPGPTSTVFSPHNLLKSLAFGPCNRFVLTVSIGANERDGLIYLVLSEWSTDSLHFGISIRFQTDLLLFRIMDFTFRGHIGRAQYILILFVHDALCGYSHTLYICRKVFVPSQITWNFKLHGITRTQWIPTGGRLGFMNKYILSVWDQDEPISLWWIEPFYGTNMLTCHRLRTNARMPW